MAQCVQGTKSCLVWLETKVQGRERREVTTTESGMSQTLRSLVSYMKNAR